MLLRFYVKLILDHSTICKLFTTEIVKWYFLTERNLRSCKIWVWGKFSNFYKSECFSQAYNSRYKVTWVCLRFLCWIGWCFFFIFSFVIFSRTRNSSSYVIRRVVAYLHSFSEKSFSLSFQILKKFRNPWMFILGKKARKILVYFPFEIFFLNNVKSTYFPYSSPF